MATVLTGGTFNRLHPGHECLLRWCKSMGRLIVVLASDRHNKKPYARPAAERKRNVEKLGIADKVVVGSSRNFAGVVHKFKPDVIILGYDQSLPDEETEKAVKEMRIKVMRCRKFGDY